MTNRVPTTVPVKTKMATTAIRMRDGVIVEVYSENEREALLSSIRGKRGVEAPVSK